MDSNFQVRISANIDDLQRSIKEAQATLREFNKSAESAATSVQKVGADMNRARLATFAFGQVIRDAGFFSQSFGLGVLAISNNIPILIDQLVLLSGVSAGFGAALSVLGSLIAAGATVFAYWAQGVERNGGTVSGAISKMGNDSESAIGKLVDYLNTPPASDMLGKAVAGLEESISMISQIMKAGVDLIIAIWDSFGTDISAVLGVFYEVVSNQFNNVLNIVRFASSIIKGDFTGAFEAILNIGKNVLNSLIGLIQNFVRITSTLLGAVVGAIDPLKGEIIKNAGRELFAFGEGLKFVSSSAGEAAFSFKDFFNGLFKGQSAAQGAKKSVDELTRSTIELSKAQSVGVTQQPSLLGTGSVVAKDISSGKQFIVQEFQDLADQANFILNVGLVNTIQDAMMGIGEALASGGNVGNAAKAGLLSGIASMAEQLGRFAIGIGLAIEGIKKALMSLNPIVAIGAGVALLALAGAARAGARNIANGGGGNTAAAPATSFGGINSGAVNFPTNTSAMAISNFTGQTTLETRVSGNDLVILMDRASKNRGNYF